MSNYNKRWHDAVWSTLGRAAARSTVVAKSLEIAGHVASYSSWRDVRGLTSPGHTTREGLWRSIWPDLNHGPVTVLEFGVASGATTRTWLEALPNPELRWHGFDTFRGLPTEWKRGGLTFAAAGTFDAGGSPPSTDDRRVTWHVGLVEDTIVEVEPDLDGNHLCVLFDLDLYEPTKVALEWLTPRFKPGDLLYFDEAYDPWHERRLLDEWLDLGVQVKPRGWTGIALLLEYVGP